MAKAKYSRQKNGYFQARVWDAPTKVPKSIMSQFVRRKAVRIWKSKCSSTMTGSMDCARLSIKMFFSVILPEVAYRL